MNWKFTDATETTAFRLLESGAIESTLVSALDARTQIDAADPPVNRIPQSVSRFQARAALHLAGLLQNVEALMADPATDTLARLAWGDAQEFKRTSPTMLTTATALGLTDAQLDELFTSAAGVDA